MNWFENMMKVKHMSDLSWVGQLYSWMSWGRMGGVTDENISKGEMMGKLSEMLTSAKEEYRLPLSIEVPPTCMVHTVLNHSMIRFALTLWPTNCLFRALCKRILAHL